MIRCRSRDFLEIVLDTLDSLGPPVVDRRLPAFAAVKCNNVIHRARNHLAHGGVAVGGNSANLPDFRGRFNLLRLRLDYLASAVFLRGVGNDDPAFGLEIAFRTSNDDAVIDGPAHRATTSDT